MITTTRSRQTVAQLPTLSETRWVLHRNDHPEDRRTDSRNSWQPNVYADSTLVPLPVLSSAMKGTGVCLWDMATATRIHLLDLSTSRGHWQRRWVLMFEQYLVCNAAFQPLVLQTRVYVNPVLHDRIVKLTNGGGCLTKATSTSLRLQDTCRSSTQWSFWLNRCDGVLEVEGNT